MSWLSKLAQIEINPEVTEADWFHQTLGMNVYTISRNNPDLNCRASGLWDADFATPQVEMVAYFRLIKCPHLRLSGELKTQRELDYELMLSGDFNFNAFDKVCKAVKAEPIIIVSPFQDLRKTRDMLFYLIKVQKCNISKIEVGNEPYIGFQDSEGKWKFDYSPETYIAFYKELRNMLFDFDFDYGLSIITHDEKRVPNWNDFVAFISPDWASFHLYEPWYSMGYDDYTNEELEKLILSSGSRVKERLLHLPNAPVHITEWNMAMAKREDNKKFYGTWLHFLYCMDFIGTISSSPHVKGACYWDGSAGAHWPLFDKEFKPLTHFKAFQLWASIPEGSFVKVDIQSDIWTQKKVGSFEEMEIPYVTAFAIKSSTENKIYLAVINKAKSVRFIKFNHKVIKCDIYAENQTSLNRKFPIMPGRSVMVVELEGE